MTYYIAKHIKVHGKIILWTYFKLSEAIERHKINGTQISHKFDDMVFWIKIYIFDIFLLTSSNIL